MKKKSWYFFEGLCWSLLLLFCNVFSGRYWWIVMFFLMWEFLDIYHPSLHAVAEQTLCDFKGGFEVCQAWLSWLYWVCNTSVQLLVLDVGNRDWGLEIKQYLGNFQNHRQHGGAGCLAEETCFTPPHANLTSYGSGHIHGVTKLVHAHEHVVEYVIIQDWYQLNFTILKPGSCDRLGKCTKCFWISWSEAIYLSKCI